MPQPTPAAPPAARPQTSSSGTGGGSSSIGPSLVIIGELSGQEDLTINGRVEGKVVLKKNSVTVGRKGQVKADIIGQTIRVEGQVHGNLFGATDVVITQTGSVGGNIVAPRVVLENGSKFKGSIDMEPATAPAPPAAKASPAKSESAMPSKAADSSTSTGGGTPPAKGGQIGLGSTAGSRPSRG